MRVCMCACILCVHVRMDHYMADLGHVVPIHSDTYPHMHVYGLQTYISTYACPRGAYT